MGIRLVKNQRTILEIFTAKPDQVIDTMVMTLLVFKNKTPFECTNSQLGSIRRALQKLAQAGYFVDLGRSPAHNDVPDGPLKKYVLPETARKLSQKK